MRRGAEGYGRECTGVEGMIKAISIFTLMLQLENDDTYLSFAVVEFCSFLLSQ